MCCCAGGWDEKFLQQESELRRVRSEKANLEQHILGMESELEALQEERTKATAEMESQRKASSCMEQQMENLRTEVSFPPYFERHLKVDGLADTVHVLFEFF